MDDQNTGGGLDNQNNGDAAPDRVDQVVDGLDDTETDPGDDEGENMTDMDVDELLSEV